MSVDTKETLAIYDRVVTDLTRCCYESPELNVNTGECRWVRCSQPATWGVYCDMHPTEEDAEKGKILLRLIQHTKEEMLWVESRGEA